MGQLGLEDGNQPSLSVYFDQRPVRDRLGRPGSRHHTRNAQLAADHVSAGAKLVCLGDGGTSLLVQLKEFVYGRGRSSGLHCAADHVRIVAYEFQA